MKRVLSILCALALTVTCFSFTTFAAGNLALSGTVFVDSIHDSYGAAPSSMNNGSQTGDRWQSANEMAENATEESTTSPYLGIFWASAQTFDTVHLYWEASDPASDGINIYVAESDASFTELAQTRFTSETAYTDNGTVWTQVTAYTQQYAENSYHKITFDEAVTAYAVKIVTFKRQDKYANTSCYEIEVYDYSSGTPFDLTKVNAAKAFVDKAFGATNDYGYSAASWSAYTTAYGNLTTAITACDGANIEDAVPGYADQDALDAVATALYEAAACLTGDGLGGTGYDVNYLADGILLCDYDNLSSTSRDVNYRTMTDGAWSGSSSDYNLWQPSGAVGNKFYLKLKNAADLAQVAMWVEHVDEEYSIEYTTEDVTAIADYSDMADVAWTDTNATRELSVDKVSSVVYQAYSFDTVEDVTALKFTVTHGGAFNAYCKVREVEAYGPAETGFSGEADTRAIDGSNNVVVFNVSEADILANPGKVMQVKFYVYKNSQFAETTVIVDTAYRCITLGSISLNAGDLNGAQPNDYLGGVLFTNASDVTNIVVASVSFVDPTV